MTPLSITSVEFFTFTAATLIIYYLLPRKAQNILLLAASYVFYITWDWRFSLALAALTLINFFIAPRLKDQPKLYWIGIAANLAFLLVFKYTDTLWAQLIAIFRLSLPAELSIFLPIGLSFYTLQAISYLTDVSRKQIEPSADLIDFALYLAYFPKMLAGPIERARTFLPQLAAPRVVDNDKLSRSVTLIVIGLVRKLVIADVLSAVSSRAVFANPEKFGAPDLLFWWIVYAFIIYNDFAGYTSIIRGISGLFGIELMQNFNQPFFSTGFIDFWNRWHISLSAWLRDYIYLPVSRALLRRNPSGKYLPNLIIPPLTTMLVSGLWHGISPHFLLWGALSGSIQAAERVNSSRKPVTAGKQSVSPLRSAINWFFFFSVSILLAVPFLYGISETFAFWANLVKWTMPKTLGGLSALRPILGMILSLTIDTFQHRAKDEVIFLKWHLVLRALLLALSIIFIFLATRADPGAPFIYQEF